MKNLFRFSPNRFTRPGRLTRILALLVICSLAAACAGRESTPVRDYAPGTRIGIFNGLKSEITHQNIGSLRFNSFKKNYAVDWNLPQHVENRIEKILKADGRYVVSTVDSRPVRELSGTATAPTFSRLSPGFEAGMEQLANQHQIDLVVFIDEFDGPCFYKIANENVDFSGYGLLTRRSVASGIYNLLPIKNNEAYAVAQIRIMIFSLRPVRLISQASPKMSRSPLKDFSWPADINHLNASDFDSIRSPILSRTDLAVSKALQEAGLIDGTGREAGSVERGPSR